MLDDGIPDGYTKVSTRFLIHRLLIRVVSIEMQWTNSDVNVIAAVA